jgi:hypothetical protein
MLIRRGGQSASAARFVGDDYQLLIALQHAVDAQRPGSGIVALELESADAPLGLDDIVVRRILPPHTYTQAKASLSAKEPLSSNWLLQASRTGGRSVLQQLHGGWRRLTEDGELPEVVVATTRSLDPADPLFRLRDHHGSLLPYLHEAIESPAGRAAERWAEHLGIDADDLAHFIASVRFDTDGTLATARAHLAAYLRLAGLDDSEKGLGALIGLARAWVEDGRRRITPQEIGADFDRLGMRTGLPAALLHVDAIERLELPAGPPQTVRLDWTRYYEGATAGERLAVSDLANIPLMEADIQMAAQRIRALGYVAVTVAGTMHLPMWFAIGSAFRDVSNVRVDMTWGGLTWASGTAGAPAPLAAPRTTHLSRGNELAVAVEITGPVEDEVRGFVRRSGLPLRALVVIARAEMNQRIRTAAEGDALARAIRDEIRALCTKERPSRLHLFMHAPAGFALLLGHYWDRLPLVVTYEWLGTGAGYAPSLRVMA